ncbi:hypothetical protein [Rhodopirellula europaea]|uniref:hypothetical protein n=1 Tax=Rhodopirellula europaea TaxID=1263866 RepID=UPI003D26C4ED|tara:strand:- start:7926 stop:8396 length:471 start_codon:yes stop_codon:yes gene_type:complete
MNATNVSTGPRSQTRYALIAGLSLVAIACVVSLYESAQPSSSTPLVSYNIPTSIAPGEHFQLELLVDNPSSRPISIASIFTCCGMKMEPSRGIVPAHGQIVFPGSATMPDQSAEFVWRGTIWFGTQELKQVDFEIKATPASDQPGLGRTEQPNDRR